jgi:hypothetical protein
MEKTTPKLERMSNRTTMTRRKGKMTIMEIITLIMVKVMTGEMMAVEEMMVRLTRPIHRFSC